MTVFKVGCQSSAFSLGLWLELIPSAPLVFRPSKSDYNYTIGSPGSLADLGLLSLHNHLREFLIVIYIYIVCVCVYPIDMYVLLILSLWRAQTNIHSQDKAPVRNRKAAVPPRPEADGRVLVVTKASLWWIRLQLWMRAAGPRTIGTYLSSLIRDQTFYVWGIGKIKILRKL